MHATYRENGVPAPMSVEVMLSLFPLNPIVFIPGCFRIKPSKSLKIERSIFESRLPWRSAAFSTSHIAMPCVLRNDSFAL